MPVEAFISYCHVDERFRKELQAHLALLRRQGLVSVWHDRMIMPGESWSARIDHALNRSSLILLLVSADFVHSDYCWGVEMTRALERHHAGKAVVVPIAVRLCDWTGAPFASLQALPTDAKPVDDWPKRDHAWTNVAQGIRSLVAALWGAPPPQRGRSVPRGSPSPSARPPRGAAGTTTPSPLDTFFKTIMDEGGKAFAREGGKLLAQRGVAGLLDALAGGTAPADEAQREEVIAEVLGQGDHRRLGNILRDNDLPVPRSKAERAHDIASAFHWNEDLVDDAFTAPLLRRLCQELDLPTGRKAEMASTLVSVVNAATR